MGVLDFLKSPDIGEGVKRYKSEKNAVLLDVRTRQEYAAGHIPGSVNLPLNRLENAEYFIPSQETPLYVYCLSGGRSRQAVSILRKMGYNKVNNIGGISDYEGVMEA